MPERDLTIGSRSYRVACNPGEESRLSQAAILLDHHAQIIAGQAGKIPESRMLLLSALLLADDMLARNDELSAFRERARTLEAGAGETESRIGEAALRAETAEAAQTAAEARLAEAEAQLAEAQAAIDTAVARANDAEAELNMLKESQAAPMDAGEIAAPSGDAMADGGMSDQSPQMGLFAPEAPASDAGLNENAQAAMALLGRVAEELETLASELEAVSGQAQDPDTQY